MDVLDAIKVIADASTNTLLLAIMWLGLKRFDRLLDLVIALAARSKLSTDEIEQIRKQVFGRNGGGKTQ